MSLWQASFWLAILGVGVVLFIALLSVIGLNTDRTGETIHPVSEASDEPAEADAGEAAFNLSIEDGAAAYTWSLS